jgi:hypothetical protein
VDQEPEVATMEATKEQELKVIATGCGCGCGCSAPAKATDNAKGEFKDLAYA